MYAFTYKLNSKSEPEAEDYRFILKLLSTKGDVLDFVYEHDSKGKLHIHGYMNFRKKPYLASLCPKGYHSMFKTIDTEEELKGWLSYMNKDKRKAQLGDQAAASQYFRRHYAFNENKAEA